MSVVRTCIRPGCGNQFKVPPSKADRRGYCSSFCADMDRRHLVARNDLQREVLEAIARERVSFAAFAKSCGLSNLTLRNWFVVRPRNAGASTQARYRRGNPTLSREAIAKIAARLGIAVEDAIVNAGGRTAEDVWARNAADLGARVAQLTAVERMKRAALGGSGNKGKRQTAEHIAKRVATRRENGGHDRALDALIAVNATLQRRIMRHLYLYLYRAKSPHPSPSTAELRTLADQVGGRSDVGLPGKAVFEVWRPYLQSHRLTANAGGRPGEIDYPLVEERRRSGAGWNAIAAIFGRDPELIRKGWQQWRRSGKGILWLAEHPGL